MYIPVATIQTQTPLSPTKKDVGHLAGMFLVTMGACVAVLAVSVLLLRMRTYRKRLAKAIGLREELAKAEAAAVKGRVDPWSESARRLQVEPEDGDDDHDTVDIDPGDLGPDDIEPMDQWHNGKGPH